MEEVQILGRSDHVTILRRITVGRTNVEDKEPMLDWKRVDWDSMRETLRDTE